MLTRNFNGVSCPVLGFGTSMFVAGRLFPDRDLSGIRTLKYFSLRGGKAIHINPKLETSWGVRKALPDCSQKKLFFKIKTSIGESERDVEKKLEHIRRIADNLLNSHFFLIHEFDIRCNKETDLHTPSRLKAENERIYNQLARRYGQGIIKRPLNRLEWDLVLDCGLFDGMADQFSLMDNWMAPDLDHLLRKSIPFIAFRPFRLGQLTESYFEQDSILASRISRCRQIVHEFYGDDIPLDIIALKYAVSHPAINIVFTGTRNYNHLISNIVAADAPFPIEIFRALTSVFIDISEGLTTSSDFLPNAAQRAAP